MRYLSPSKTAPILALLMVLGGCASQPARDMVEAQAQVGIRVDGDIQERFNRAATYLGQEKYDEAIVLLEQIVKSDDRLAAPHLNLGMAYARKGELQQAEAEFLKAMALSQGGDARVNNELGIVYRKMGRFIEARKAYENALAKDDAFIPAHKNLGILCEIYLRDFQCALEQFQIYQTALPDDKEIGVWLAEVKKRLDQ